MLNNCIYFYRFSILLSIMLVNHDYCSKIDNGMQAFGPSGNITRHSTRRPRNWSGYRDAGMRACAIRDARSCGSSLWRALERCSPPNGNSLPENHVASRLRSGRLRLPLMSITGMTCGCSSCRTIRRCGCTSRGRARAVIPRTSDC